MIPTVPAEVATTDGEVWVAVLGIIVVIVLFIGAWLYERSDNGNVD